MPDLLKSLKDVFHAHANQTALKSGDVTLSYGQVDAVTDRLAKTLASRSEVGPVLYFGKPDIVSHLYGIACLKAGQTFVFLNANLTFENIRGIASRLYAEPVILTDKDADTSLYPGLEFVVVPDPWTQVPNEFEQFDLPGPCLETIVSCQTTSGTTGTPKIVPWTYADFHHHTRLSGLALELTCGDVVGNSGDFILEHLLIALLNGATMSFCQISKASAHTIRSWITGDAVTVLCCYINVFRILQHAESRFDSIRTVICYGDSPLASDLKIFEKICVPGAKFYNGYGMQETGYVIRSVHEHGSEIPKASVPLGYPLVEGSIVLIDETGEPVPLGQTGEVVIREPLLSVHKTGEANSIQGNERLRHRGDVLIGFGTGDLARLDGAGCLHFSGRQDDQVKISGYNVRLFEIETAALELSGVSQAAVSAHEMDLGSRVLCCHYVGGADPETIRIGLKAKLPSFMQPHHFQKLDELPRNGNGKIVRRELRFDATAATPLKTGMLEQATEAISAIWTSLLGHSSFDMNSSFSDVGGHSLASIKLSLEIEREFEVHIEFSEFAEAGMSIFALLQLLQSKGVFKNTGQKPEPWEARRVETVSKPAASAAELLTLNKKILSQWPGDMISGFDYFKCQNQQPEAIPVVWIFQERSEYINLSDALGPGYALYGGRSFSGLAGEFRNASEKDLSLYQQQTVLEAARAYLAEILELTGGRSFVLGGNCQGALITLCMADRLARMNHRIKGLVMLNHLEDRQDYAMPVTLLFGQQEFEDLAQQPKGLAAFSNRKVKILKGTHGGFFQSAEVREIVEEIYALS